MGKLPPAVNEGMKPEREPQIPHEIRRANDILETLRDVVAVINNRLATALRDPEPSQEGSDETKSQRVPLAYDIFSIGSQVQEQIDRLRDVNDRLEL